MTPRGSQKLHAIPKGLPGTLPTDFGFTGQRNEGFGLYDYNARYYGPLLARFVSADTIVPSPGEPQSFNRYAYVYNNALRYTDPSGRGLFSDVLKALGNSGSLGRKLVVAMADVVHHVNAQTQKVFWPSENTTAGERLVACAEIGGGSVIAAAASVELVAGTLTHAALAGGAAEVATTGTTAATAACADGDCTNEAQMALDAGARVVELVSADGDPTNEIEAITRPLAIQDFGIEGSIEQLRGTFSVSDGVATVRVDMIEGSIGNPFQVLHNLSETASSAGASTLKIEGTLGNEQLYRVLQRYGEVVTHVTTDIIEISLGGD